MTFPLDIILDTPQLFILVSCIVGFGFGFVLEKAGFGRADKLAAQFYFRDMTVLKVMFTGIVTASLGLVMLDGLGLVDAVSIATGAASWTYVWPMLFGGLLLGVGFVVAGYCPGTSTVAAASGNVDGVAAFGGIVAGSLLFGELQPLFAEWTKAGNLQHYFLDELLGVERPVVALLVTAVALGAFFGAEKVEAWFRAKDGTPELAPAPLRAESRTRNMVFAALAALAVLAPITLFAPDKAVATRPAMELMDAESLANSLVAQPWSLRIIDVRSTEAWTKARIPGSESAPLGTLETLGLDVTKDSRGLVLVGDDRLEEAPAPLAAYRGKVYLLEGGFPAWQTYALDKPAPPGDTATAQEREDYAFRAALNGLLTGEAAAPPPKPVKRAVKRGGGGGGCD